jgi:hypothetical protein
MTSASSTSSDFLSSTKPRNTTTFVPPSTRVFVDNDKKDVLLNVADQELCVSEKQFAKRKAEAAGLSYADIIEVTQYVSHTDLSLSHTTETHASEVYQLILSSVHTALGDQAQDIVRSTADAVLETLKNNTSTKRSSRTVKAERILFPRILSTHFGFSIKSQKPTPTQLPLPTRLHLFSAFLAPNPALATAKSVDGAFQLSKLSRHRQISQKSRHCGMVY